LTDCISIVSAASSRYRLRSAEIRDNVLLRTRTKFGEQGFWYYGPVA